MEIEDDAELSRILTSDQPLTGMRLQSVDLTNHEIELMRRLDLRGLVVLGGRLSPRLQGHLLTHGALVFPEDPTTPVDVYRPDLYTAPELYAGIDGPLGYAGTPDARAYAWARDARTEHDAYATLQRAIHDDQITDALVEFVDGLKVVGIMGSHAAGRGTPAYARAARVGHDVASAGLLVATGGGPGLMEAANLGARCPDPAALEQAIQRLTAVPDFHDDVTAWARLALDVLADLPPHPQPRSLGIPTWFYGHEPPGVFADAIAKYFSNALREDGLMTRSTAGVVALPGAAGTVQEIFQAATKLYYTRREHNLPVLVLVNKRHWTQQVPAWPVVQALGAGRPMASAIHLVETAEEAVDIVVAAASAP